MPAAPHQPDGAGSGGLGTSFTFRPVITERARQTPARSTKDLLDHLYTNPTQKRKKQQQAPTQQQDEGAGDYHSMETPTPNIDDIDDDIPEPELIYSLSMSPIEARIPTQPTDPHAALASPSKFANGSKKVTPRQFSQVYKSLLNFRNTADVRRKEKAKQLMDRQGLQDVPTINRHSKTLAAGRYKGTGGDIWTELYHRSTISSAGQNACPSPVSARSPSPAPRSASVARYTPYFQDAPQYAQTLNPTNDFHQFEFINQNQNSLFPSSSSGPLPNLNGNPKSSASPSPPVSPHRHVAKAVPIVIAGQGGNELYKSASGSSWYSGEDQINGGEIESARNAGDYSAYGGPRFEPKRAASATPLSSRMTQRSGVSRAPIPSSTPRGMASTVTRQGYPNHAQQNPMMGMMPGSGFPIGYLRGQGWGAPPPQQNHIPPGMYPGMNQPPPQYKHNQQFFGGPQMNRMGFHAMPW